MSDFESLSRKGFQADASRKSAQQEADELSRGSFHPDAQAKAAEQESWERREEERQRTSRPRSHEEARGSHVPVEHAHRQPTPRRRSSSHAHDEARKHDASQVRADRQPTPRSRAQSPAYEGSAHPHCEATPHPREDGRDLADHTVMRRTTDAREQGAAGGAVVSKRSGLVTDLRRRLRERGAADPAVPGASARRPPRPDREARASRGRGLRIHPLIIAVLLVVGLYLLVCVPIDRAISLSDSEREGLSQELSWHVPGMPYYVLALGSDAREGETVSRSDTMILVRVDPLGGKLTMLSIPRDTKVEIEGYGTQKINAAYAFGGTAGAVRAVHELTGAPISHVAIVHFDGVEQLVDHLGGVTVDVPVEVYDPYYTGLVLPAGEQEMDGATALLFSRVRHGFDLGDYQRQKDQRILIEAIMHKALALPPWKLPGLVGNMGGMLGTTMRMYSILPLLVRLKLGSPTIYQATVPSTTDMIDGVSYVIADEAGLAQMMKVIDAGGDPATLS